MVRNSFVFYKSFFEAIKELEDKDKGIISYAIMEYGLTGELPNLRGYLKSMFLLIKPQIDANNKKYESGCVGGRPLKVKENQSITKQKPKGNHSETKPKPKDKQRETKAYSNEDVDVDVDVNEDVDVKGKGDGKGKNQVGIEDSVDNSKTEKEDRGLKQSLKPSFLWEDPPKQASNKGIKDEKDRTDFRNGERQGTENDRTNNGRTENSKSTASEEGITMPASAEIISSTSANTFKARVEYAKSLGIEERVARKICNFAQSKKFPLFETHYKGFVGKSEKEVEEAFSVLKLVVQRGKETKFQKSNGLTRINSS
jgi:hypothetical protein